MLLKGGDSTSFPGVPVPVLKPLSALSERSQSCRRSPVSPKQFPSGLKVRGRHSPPAKKAADLWSLDLYG